MYAEDLVVDHDGQSEKVKHVCEVVPHVRIAVFSAAFRVEAI